HQSWLSDQAGAASTECHQMARHKPGHGTSLKKSIGRRETKGEETMGAIDELAIGGGSPVVSREKHRVWPEIRSEDFEAVRGVLERGVLAGANAPEVTALQREWAEYLGVEYCL